MTHETKHDPADDPRLTAYALGELPANERAEIEALLAKDDAARRFVEETRAFAATFAADIAAAPATAATPALTDAQRAVIRDRARVAPKGRVLRLTNWAVPATAAAAMLVGVAFSMRHEIGRWWSGERDVARAEADARFGTVRLSTLSPAAGSAPRLAEPAGRFRGPGGEIPPDSREPSDPAPGPSDPTATSAKRAADRLRGLTEVTGFPDGDQRPDKRQILEAVEKLRKAAAGDPRPGGRGRNGAGAGGDASKLPAGASGPVAAGAPLRDAEEELAKVLRDIEVTEKRLSEAGRRLDRTSVLAIREKSLEDRAEARGGALTAERILREMPVTTAAWGADACDGEALTGLSELRVFFERAPNSTVTATSWSMDLADGDVEVVRIVTELRTRVVANSITVEQAVERLRSEVVNLQRSREQASRESYAAIHDNPFRTITDSPLSTFGIDVDTASYSNVRRFLRDGQFPPPGAVRIEEMINSFRYAYAAPLNGDPFAVHAEVAGCPWNTEHRLVRIGLKGREVDLTERPNSNLVFLVDVSGSMQPANKLPLLVESMKLLAGTLDARDKVSIVVYAGAAGMVLPPTPGDQRETILGALDRLRAGGSTAGGAGIALAYSVAQENFVAGGVNRVILATDGDFNVGVSDESSLVRLIEEKAKSKVFLTVLGFGTGNLQDSKMEAIANKGNGNYAYVDSLKEGRKVLVEQAASTLMTIAKDVKLQVEFNPVRVASYRLIGYENRMLATEDFADDRKDAGDMGAGHTVTALYEIVPATITDAAPGEPLRYQQGGSPSAAAHSGELFTVKLRWKAPEGDVSSLREIPVQDSARGFDAASPDFHLAASVASFGMLLRGSPHRGGANWDMTIELAQSALAGAPGEDRTELVELITRAKELAR